MHYIDANALKIPQAAWEQAWNLPVEQHEDYVSFKRWWDKVEDGGPLSQAEDILPLAWPRGGQEQSGGGADGDL